MVHCRGNFLRKIMIEIEKKYLIDDEKVQEIVKDADFLGQKELTDIYN